MVYLTYVGRTWLLGTARFGVAELPILDNEEHLPTKLSLRIEEVPDCRQQSICLGH